MKNVEVNCYGILPYDVNGSRFSQNFVVYLKEN